MHGPYVLRELILYWNISSDQKFRSINVFEEIQRHASILNMNIWRFTNVDTEIGGYPVPKHTIVAAELSLILADEATFSNSKEVRGSFGSAAEIVADKLTFKYRKLKIKKVNF
ncbi:hypothetical protein COOONC_26968 [Cooperia oncophora]